MVTINHLHFASTDVEGTCAFYERFFGFKLRKKIHDTLVLQNNSGFILAIDRSGKTKVENETRLHFGFTLSDPKEVETLFEKMRREEVTFESKLLRLGEKAIHYYCRDPAGQLIEVGWYEFSSAN